MASGWQSLGNAIGGGNTLPNALAYEQGQSLGANTASALAEARSRVVKNSAIAQLDQNLRGIEPDDQKRAALVGQLQAGVNPQTTAESQLSQFKLGQQQQVADPNTSPAQTARSLLSIGQNANLTHAVGEAGSFTNELTPGQVNVSPLGAAIARGTVAKDAATAAASNSEVPLHAAQAREANINADNGGKLPTGYLPLIDQATGQPKIDPTTGRPQLTRWGGGPADIDAPKPIGAVAMRGVNRMIDSAFQSSADMGNIMNYPAGNTAPGVVGATLGMFGAGQGPQKSLMDSVKADMGNRAAPEAVRAYTTMASGLSRSMASLEAGGMVPSGAFTDSFNKLQNTDGDTNEDILRKSAQIRQITENALNSVIMDNTSIPADRKAKAQQVLDRMEAAIPFTVQDVNKLHNSQGNQTFAQIAGLQGLGPKPAAPAVATAATAASSAAVAPPPAAIAMLRAHPELADQFKAKYGSLPGAP